MSRTLLADGTADRLHKVWQTLLFLGACALGTLVLIGTFAGMIWIHGALPNGLPRFPLLAMLIIGIVGATTGYVLANTLVLVVGIVLTVLGFIGTALAFG